MADIIEDRGMIKSRSKKEIPHSKDEYVSYGSKDGVMVPFLNEDLGESKSEKKGKQKKK